MSDHGHEMEKVFLLLLKVSTDAKSRDFQYGMDVLIDSFIPILF